MRTRARPPRGNTLLVAMILLTVLSLIGVASVRLSSEERNNAASKSKVDFIEACANAAQAKIWAEMGQYGMSYLGSTVTVTAATLPDGTRIIAPAHYRNVDSATTALVKDVVFKVDTTALDEASMEERDRTNGGAVMSVGSTWGITAVCQDAANRAFEVELAVKFAL